MCLLINNIHKNFRNGKTEETHVYHAIRENYAINCAIQGVRLIWKQKIWLAICKFLWSLINHGDKKVLSWGRKEVCHEENKFCHGVEKRFVMNRKSFVIAPLASRRAYKRYVSVLDWSSFGAISRGLKTLLMLFCGPWSFSLWLKQYRYVSNPSFV